MFVNVNGARIHFSESGAGVPVLFLHGIPDSGAVWNDVIVRMRDTNRCIAPDLPGFGLSAVPEGFRVTLEDMADFVEDFIMAIGLTEPINLVVHDIGGPFGLAWAARYPHRVKSIAILNTVFQPDYQWHRYGRICRTPVLGELLQLLTSQSGLARAMRKNSGLRKPSREHISATYSRFTRPVRRMVLRLYRGLDPAVFETWDAKLRDIASSIPSLVLWGDGDTYIGQTFASRFGAKQVRHFPERGHWLMLEIPEVISQSLLELYAVDRKVEPTRTARTLRSCETIEPL